MKPFLKDVLTYCGAQVEEQDEALRVVFPEEGAAAELAEALGKQELRLVFEASHVDAESDLVAVGSHVLRVLEAYLAPRGQRAYVIQSSEHRLTQKALRQQLQTQRGLSLRIDDRQAAAGHDLYVVYRLRYHTLERKDALKTARVRVRPGANVSDPLRLDATLADPPAAESWTPRPRKQAPADVLAAGLARADAEITAHARVESRHKQEEARRAFKKDLSRVHAYYIGQIAEYNRRRKSDLSQIRIEELEEERELRVRELVAATAVGVDIEPMQLLTVEVPLQTARLVLYKKGAAGSVAELSVLFDRSSGAVELPPCPACDGSLAHAVLGGCDAGHPVHEECLRSCERCAATACGVCGDERCAICEQTLCGSCATGCPGCEETVCSEHQATCSLCQGPGCGSCLKTCASCGALACKADYAAARGSRAVVCASCARRCPGCETPTVTPELVRCGTCGRRFCSECHPKSASACVLCAS